jgi:4-amino-4-deoxy-L-arabinose transferase-like glycosyltransferase
VLAGTATVAVVYAIARVSVGRAAGLIAAGMIAVAPFAVFYGIEARPYATMIFLVAVSTLALMHALRTRHPAWWILYTLATAAAAYTHYTAIFLLAAQGAYSLWAGRDRLAQPLLANAAVVLLYLPWLPNLRGKALAVIGALYPLSVHRVVGDLLRPFPGHPSAPLSAIPTLVGLIVFALCVLAGVVATVTRAGGRSPGVQWRPRGLPLLIGLALATPVGLLAYSLLVTDLWLPRGLSASIPASALVIGALLSALPRPWLMVATTGVLAVLLLGTLRSFESAYARGPFRSIAAQLDRIAPRRDPVALISLVGYLAVQEQFRAPHTIVHSVPELWRSTSVGANAYLVLDDQIAKLGRLGTPHHPGYKLISRTHYAGASATAVLVYRRVTGA